jgi:hypothetical protein
MSEQNTESADPSALAQMFQFILSFMTPQAIHVAAQLGIADIVAKTPATVEELTAATNTDAPALGRLLKFLISVGVFAEDADGKYRHTRLSETLRSDYPQSMRSLAVLFGSELLWRPFGELRAKITTGRPAFDKVFGKSFFEYLAEHPEDAAAFNAAMTASSSLELAQILAAYDFSRFERIVDVGGGHGALLHGILSANPGLRGVLVDLPSVVAGASALGRGTIADRCEIVGVDFFQEIPRGADAYMTRAVLHDWNDEDCLRILKNCRGAIRPEGKLLLIESVLKPPNQPDLGRFNDLTMLVLGDGARERTEAEFGNLLREAGFSLTRVIRSTDLLSIIESQPV